MSAELSAYIRLGATLVMLSILLCNISIVITISLSYFTEYMDTLQYSYYNSVPTIMAEMQMAEEINGAAAFKLAEDNEALIKEITIAYLNAGGAYDIVADHNTLLRNAHKRFSISVSQVANGHFIIRLVEVK